MLIPLINVTDFKSRFPCPNLCGRSYKYKRGVHTHVKFECGVEPRFMCTVCPKKFARKFQLESHLVLKHKIVKIRCDFTNHIV